MFPSNLLFQIMLRLGWWAHAGVTDGDHAQAAPAGRRMVTLGRAWSVGCSWSRLVDLSMVALGRCVTAPVRHGSGASADRQVTGGEGERSVCDVCVVHPQSPHHYF